MEKNKVILTILAVLVAVVLLYAVIGLFGARGDIGQSGIEPGLPVNTASAAKTVLSGSTDPGDVEIGLTPQGVASGKLSVAIAANTHSVDLSPFDLKQMTELELDGRKIKPAEAPTLSGHHASGILVFDVGQDITKFTIKIKGIPKVEERAFSWS